MVVNSDIYVLKTAIDDTSMNSPITIKDSDDELIDVDASCNTSKDDLDNDQNYKSDNSSAKHLYADNVSADKIFVDAKMDIDEKYVQLSQSDEIKAQPVFKVMFRDESISRQYRQQIKHFLHSLVQSESHHEKDINESSLILEVWDSKDNSVYQNTSINIVNSVLNDNIQNSNDDVICESLFVLDTQPKLKDDLDVPTYGKKYEDVLEESNSAETTQPKDFLPKMSCFNCMGNHNMRDCQLPKNYVNINKNRKEFAAKNNSKLGTRYHLNEEQKFGHMIPGQLSQNLRMALGLKDHELPRHIYKMRMLGYPPGWLEEARLQHSGLSLFNSDGIAEADPSAEEGEITTDTNRDLYDTKRIYDFPGFNVLPPPGTLDEAHKIYAPPMQEMHSKKTMLLYLQGKKADDGYKRKKLNQCIKPINDSQQIPNEMEIDELGEDSVVEDVPINELFIPPLPKESMIKPPPPPLLSEIKQDDIAIRSPGTNSPSLSDLESTKKRLLVELEDISSQSNSDGSLINVSNTEIRSDEQSFNMPVTPVSNRSSTPRRSLNTSYGSTKSIDLGTPILQSTSPFNRLPSSEKFSKDICNVMNFENLPDSTGKYEQMTGLLQKVRRTLSKLNEES